MKRSLYYLLKLSPGTKYVKHTFRVNTLRRGDSRRIPDSVLELNKQLDYVVSVTMTHVAAISRTSTISSSKHLQRTFQKHVSILSIGRSKIVTSRISTILVSLMRGVLRK